jgi:hypothetical protein
MEFQIRIIFGRARCSSGDKCFRDRDIVICYVNGPLVCLGLMSFVWIPSFLVFDLFSQISSRHLPNDIDKLQLIFSEAEGVLLQYG